MSGESPGGAVASSRRDGVTADTQVRLLSQVMGGLADDEHALAYGALYAADASRGLDEPPATVTGDLELVLGRFRSHHCAWCDTGLGEHRIDIGSVGTRVRCQRTEQSRPVDEWLGGPVRTPAWRWLVAIVLWVGIPLASLGLLAWVMPTVAALVHRRRRWVIAASVWVTSFLVTIVWTSVAPDGLLFGFLALTQWVAAVVYGGLQVKPWLAALPTPKRGAAPHVEYQTGTVTGREL